VRRTWPRSSTSLLRRAAVLSLLVAASAFAAGTAPSVKARVERVLSRRSYQTELPDAAARERQLHFGRLDPSLARLLAGLGIAAALVGAGAMVFALVRRAGDTTKPPVALRPDTSPAAPRPTRRTHAQIPSLADADRLAETGDYREAVHALLLVAIDESARLTASSFPPSATARELTRLLPLEGARRAGFGALVGAVERSMFAGREVDADHYTTCRAHCLLVANRTSA